MSILARAIDAAERVPLPDAVTLAGIDWLVGRTRRRLGTTPDADEVRFADEMARFPIAVHTDEANAQHYEVPSAFFGLVLQNTMEGFFADPVYGGNRDMVAWKMLGFPGARYDYRDHVERHGQRYPLPPVSIAGRPEWAGKAD